MSNMSKRTNTQIISEATKKIREELEEDQKLLAEIKQIEQALDIENEFRAASYFSVNAIRLEADIAHTENVLDELEEALGRLKGER